MALKSPSILAAVRIGFGGLAFSLGNLMFAESLPVAEFTVIVLIMAVSQIAMCTGPLGADTLVNRTSGLPAPDAWLRVLANCALVAALLTAAAGYYYEFSISNSFILFIICFGCGMNQFASAVFQSRQDFRKSQWLRQIHNVIFLLAAAATVWLGLQIALPAILAIAVGYLLVPYLVWGKLASESAQSDAPNVSSDIKWDDGYSIVGNTLATIILMTLERLAIPNLLGEKELATFAVLAAISGAPFKILQTVVRFTLLPRLRATRSKKEARHILGRESTISGAATLASCFAVLIVTPIVIELFFAEKFFLGTGLIVAALVGGIGKVLSSFTAVITTSLGTKGDLQKLNYWSWISLAIAVIAAIAGSSYGLTGLVYGVSLGWYVYSLAGLALSLKYVID
jgi:O-antigen/teichoic acid export membrane protein